jgi:hypothetical protein
VIGAISDSETMQDHWAEAHGFKGHHSWESYEALDVAWKALIRERLGRSSTTGQVGGD